MVAMSAISEYFVRYTGHIVFSASAEQRFL